MLREVISNEWYTILIVLCLGILAFAKYSYSTRFSDFVGLVGNSNYLKIYSKEQKFVDQFEALLFINLIISGSIFIFLCYSTLIETIEFNILNLLKIVLAIGALLLIKVLLERLIGSVFEIDQLIDDYLFQKTNYKNYTGLLLLPVNIILIFAIQPNVVLIYSILGIIIALNFLGFLSSFKSHQKVILGNFFYFILYLCALEIGPYVILYKVIN